MNQCLFWRSFLFRSIVSRPGVSCWHFRKPAATVSCYVTGTCLLPCWHAGWLKQFIINSMIDIHIMTVCLRVSPCRGLAACRDKARASSSLQNQEGCRCDRLRSCEFGLLSVVFDIWNISFYHHLRYQPVWGDTGKVQQELFKENSAGKCEIHFSVNWKILGIKSGWSVKVLDFWNRSVLLV